MPARPHFLHNFGFQLGATCLAGLGMLALLQIPAVNYSTFGQPDREMIGQAFSLKANVPTGEADPILFLDIDDDAILGHLKPAPFGAPPDDRTPRDLVAHLLQYVARAPASRRPKAVLLDVDIANTVSDAGAVTLLRDTLAAWAASPASPTLVISRESFPARYMGLEGRDWVLPATPYDAVVEGSKGRIVWAASRVLSDAGGVVREFSPQGCVRTAAGERPLPSDAAAVYRAAAGGVPTSSPLAAPLAKTCPAGASDGADSPGELIDYQFSYPLGRSLPNWGDVPKTWSGYADCGRDQPAAFLQTIPAGAVEDAGADADLGVLCRRIVLIGGTNTIGNDVAKTPLGVMPGVMILANAIHGLEVTHGGLRKAPLAIQGISVAAMSVMVWSMSRFSAYLWARYAALRSRTKRSHVLVQIWTVPLHPIVAQWLLGAVTFYIDIGLLVIALDHGYWGYLSAPAFAAVVAGMLQTFSLMQKSVEAAEGTKGEDVE